MRPLFNYVFENAPQSGALLTFGLKTLFNSGAYISRHRNNQRIRLENQNKISKESRLENRLF